MILEQMPDEDIDYNFEDQLGLDYYGDKILICGNRDFKKYGTEEALEFIKEVDCTPSMLAKALSAHFGGQYHYKCINGYSQSDWQYVFYTEDIADRVIEEIENFYFGKVKELIEVEDDGSYGCAYYIPDDIFCDGKKAIAEYLDLDADALTIREIKGRRYVYDYKEMD